MNKSKKQKKHKNKPKRFSSQFNLSLLISALICLGLFSCIDKNMDNTEKPSQNTKIKNTLPSEIRSIAAITNKNTISNLPKKLPLNLKDDKIKTLIINFTEPMNLTQKSFTLTFNQCPPETQIVFRDHLFFSNADSPLSIKPEQKEPTSPENQTKKECSLKIQIPQPETFSKDINFYKINQVRISLSSETTPKRLEIVKTNIE